MVFVDIGQNRSSIMVRYIVYREFPVCEIQYNSNSELV